jgi:hypothetical protein
MNIKIINFYSKEKLLSARDINYLYFFEKKKNVCFRPLKITVGSLFPIL